MKTCNGIIVQLYNLIISLTIINCKNKFFRRIRASLYHNICYECKAKFGNKNPNRFFYVIRCPKETLGLFGLFNYVLYHVRLAVERNLEPVVDWKYYPNSSILTNSHIGKENMWDFYFRPMSGILLEEVYKSKNVIMSSGRGPSALSEVYDQTALLESNKLISKYMNINDNLLQTFNKVYKERFNKKRVLGVICRGTDFTATKPTGHSICPDINMTIRTIEEKIEEWGKYDAIFLATEDKMIEEKLRSHFGNILFTYQSKFVTYSEDKWLNAYYENEKQPDINIRGIEYLGAIYLISKCNALIAPVIGGTLGAMRMCGEYENVFLFQLGNYK